MPTLSARQPCRLTDKTNSAFFPVEYCGTAIFLPTQSGCIGRGKRILLHTGPFFCGQAKFLKRQQASRAELSKTTSAESGIFSLQQDAKEKSGQAVCTYCEVNFSFAIRCCAGKKPEFGGRRFARADPAAKLTCFFSRPGLSRQFIFFLCRMEWALEPPVPSFGYGRLRPDSHVGSAL